MTDQPRILPVQLIQAVDLFVYKEQADAARYDNREVLDESGIYSLHLLAASIYAAGYDDGDRASETRASGRRQRAIEEST